MHEKHEVRIHGRGGQGAVLACSILAQALIDDGKYAVAIPSFGFERRGAPVAAFLRFDTQPIRAMTNVYHPDCVVCIDPTVPRTVDIFAGMKPGGTVVLTTKAKLEELSFPDAVSRVGLCDAVGIALSIYRKPVTNAVMTFGPLHPRLDYNARRRPPRRAKNGPVVSSWRRLDRVGLTA